MKIPNGLMKILVDGVRQASIRLAVIGALFAGISQIAKSLNVLLHRSPRPRRGRGVVIIRGGLDFSRFRRQRHGGGFPSAGGGEPARSAWQIPVILLVCRVVAVGSPTPFF